MICEKCKSTVFKHVSYRNSEAGELIEYFSCCNCSTIVFPEVDHTAVVKPKRSDISLVDIVRRFPDRIEGIKQESGWDAVLNWIQKDFGMKVNRSSLIASYCNSRQSVYPADQPVKEHLSEIKQRLRYGVGYEPIARWLKEQTGMVMSGKALQRSVARVERTLSA